MEEVGLGVTDVGERKMLCVGTAVGRKENPPRGMNGVSQSPGPVRRGTAMLGVVGTKLKLVGWAR